MAVTNLTPLVGQVMNTMTTAATSMSGNLISEGRQLSGVLIVIVISYHLVLSLLGDDWVDAQIAIFNSLIKWAIVTVLLAGWVNIVGDLFTKGFNSLANTAAGSSATSASGVLDMGIDTIKGLYNLGYQDANGLPCDPTTSTCASTAPKTVDEAKWYEVAHVFENAVWKGIGFILKSIAAIAVSLLLIAFIAISTVGLFMLAIGLATGPILIPFLIVAPLKGLFDSWLKFMLTGGFIKIVAAITIAIVAEVFKQLARLSNTLHVPTNLGVDVLGVFIMIIFAAIATYIMWQVPTFTGQLVGGGGGADGRGMARGMANLFK
jgi:TrbL/VirB6 plasmid conjugal transfer protein